MIRHHLPSVEYEPAADYNPRLERPPKPPAEACHPVADSSSEAVKDWVDDFEWDVKKLGENVQRHICKDVCTAYNFQGPCRFLFPHEVHESSSYDPETKSITLRTLEPDVNYFNPEVLVMCRHNHDMKCILSGKAAQAAMFYISNYITKL
ncbi:hypothetical protein EXIGLDRAFT_629850, partial [Exidia glandulosa HHB12029]